MARTPLSFTKSDYADSFRVKFPDIDISNDIIFDILNTAGSEIAESLLADGDFKLASRIGELNIRKFKPKGQGAYYGVAVDKYLSRELKKTVFQFNDHTGGFMYRILWNKRKCKNIADKNMWVFKPIRSLKRRLAQMLKNEGADYPIATREIAA